MSNISSSDFVRGGHGHATSSSGFWTEVSLFLYYNDYAVADSGRGFAFEDFDAFGDGGSGVVDYVDHGLRAGLDEMMFLGGR